SATEAESPIPFPTHPHPAFLLQERLPKTEHTNRKEALFKAPLFFLKKPSSVTGTAKAVPCGFENYRVG
ncbi:MAG: hypothetical protein J6J07_09075, partial [Oscillospiraceae bacterium]|nr:hypothetical protein [Oscillospiraceae bacterium]